MSSKVTDLTEITDPTGSEEHYAVFGGDKKILTPNIYSAPGFGQIIFHSSARKKIFNFTADGSDERAKMTSVFSYLQDETAAGRDVTALAGIGDYGLYGDGHDTKIANGSENFKFLGSGRGSRFGFSSVGANPAGPNFGLFEFSPETAYYFTPTAIAVAVDNVTVTLTLPSGHGGIVDSYVRAERLGSAILEGLHKLTAVTATTITFVSPTPVIDAIGTTALPASLALGTAPSVSVFNNYLSGCEVGNFSLYDVDPAAHTNGGEETHGMFLKGLLNPIIHPVYGVGVGDEVVETSSTEGALIKYVEAIESPSVQTGGGGALSIKNGTHNTTVDFLHIKRPYDNPDSGALTYGLSLKTSGSPRDMSGVIVNRMIVENPFYSGVNFATTNANIKDVHIYNYKCEGGARAISQGGSSFNLENINFYNSSFVGQTEKVVDLSRTVSNTKGVKFFNTKMDGSRLNSSTKELIRIAGTDCLIKDCDLSNAGLALKVIDGVDIVMQGGRVSRCGDATSAGVPFDDDSADDDRSTVIDGVKITECFYHMDTTSSASLVFAGIHTVRNCPAIETVTAGQLTQGTTSGVINFDDNKRVNNRARNTGSNGSYSRNEFTHTTAGSLGMLNIDGSDNFVVGNIAPNMTSNNFIEEVSGEDGNTILHNESPMPITLSGLQTRINSAEKGALANMTTTERDTLTLANGMQIYNTTTNTAQSRENGAWV